jgi:gas vesicle protein
MKVNKLLIGVVLGMAIGAPIAIFAEDLRERTRRIFTRAWLGPDRQSI